MGHSLQALGLRTSATNEDDTVGLDVFLCFYEIVDAFVGSVTSYKEYNLLMMVLSSNLFYRLFVANLPHEIFLDDAVGYYLGLVAIIVDRTGRMDIVRTCGQNEICLTENHLFEMLDQFI